MKNHQAVYINYDEVQPDEVSMSHVVKSIGLDFFQLQAAILYPIFGKDLLLMVQKSGDHHLGCIKRCK